MNRLRAPHCKCPHRRHGKDMGNFMNLEVSDLTLSLGGKQILKSLSFRCGKGITAIMGENGAGKTTLLKTLLGLLPPDSGSILLGGRDLRKLRPGERTKLLSYLPQDCQAAGIMVLEFVVMGRNPYLKFWQTPGQTEYRLAEEALEELGIAHLRNRTMEHLSGGERRLCYLARAKVQESRWMILDEPESGLDYGRRYQIFAKLREYLTKYQKNAIMSIHDPLLADRFADRIILIQGGKVLDCIEKTQTDYEEKMTAGLCKLYGSHLDWIHSPEGKAIIWKGDSEC